MTLRMLGSLAAALLAAGWAEGASTLRSGTCPPGLVRPGPNANAPGPGGAVTISEGTQPFGLAASPSSLDCLFDERGIARAALFPPAPGQPYAEIVVYEGAGSIVRDGQGRTLTAPLNALRFDWLPAHIREEVGRLAGETRTAKPDPPPPAPPREPHPSELITASHNPLRPQPANFTPERVRVIRREYDDFDRVESETVDLEDGGTATIRYSYYLNGLRKTVTDAAGRVTFYEYDGRNRLSRVTTNQGLPDQQVTEYEYWPDNLLKTIRRPNGTVTDYTYDRADRLKTIVVRRGEARLAAYEYGYDPAGNRTSQVEENGGPPETTTYTYDNINRLKTVTYPDGKTVAYGYDGVGNRTAETIRDGMGAILSDKTAVFDAINRLTTVTDSVDPTGNASFTYDRNGNLLTKTTSAGTQEHRYDVQNLLVETREGQSIAARFAYDAFGRRYLKIGAEGVRQYLYDQTSLLQELDEDDQEVAKYEYGSTELLSFFRRDEPRRYFHLDGLGSVTGLSDAGGDMLARYHLDAWGNFREPAELEVSKNRFAFTGYLFDTETDLYYAKARLYDPQFGRFTTQDSFLGRVDEPPSLHRYFYGYANPLRYIDPTGHAPQQVAPDPDSHEGILASATQAKAEQDRRLAKLKGPGSEEAGRTTQAVVVDEDHGPLGNIVEGAAEWIANSGVGRKVRRNFERLGAFAKKTGSASSGFAHSQAGAQDQVQLASKADAARALEGEYTQRIVQENIGKGVEQVGADLARKGAEELTREGVPTLLAAGASRGLRAGSQAADDLLGATRIGDELPFAFDGRRMPLRPGFVHDDYVRWVRGPKARQATFETPWSASRGLGVRRFDDYDPLTKTAFEGNTTPWSEMSQRQLSRKLDQAGSDFTLLQRDRSDVQRIIWFGTEELPKTGLGAQLGKALKDAGIEYWVVRP